MHCDNTEPVYIQNYVGVYLAPGQERERGREGGGERERERGRQRIKEKQKKGVCVKEIEEEN